MHLAKSSTPTMGGVVFISTTLIASLFCVKFSTLSICALLCLILFALIGFVDDYNKIIYKNNIKGLSPKMKLFLLALASFICVLPLYFSIGTELYIPFYKYPLFDMGIFSIVFWILVLLSSSNAVNLTDGLDGLATMPCIFSLLSLGAFMYLSGSAFYSAYLLLPRVLELGELVVIVSALIGALIAFLWYNCHPAQLFMGDSGSLALGGFLGFLAIASKNEILLILIGFVFVLETISVILQVGIFKLFHKRFFKMAPIHHHFEKKGWPESKIIIRFWIISLLTNLLALMTIKLR